MTIFPLPLAPFEDYLRVDDHVEHPMHFFCRMTFGDGDGGVPRRSTLDRDVFEKALDTALRRHPLLQAVLRRSGFGRFEWVVAEQRPAIRWTFSAEPFECGAAPPIDLAAESGLRFYVNEHDGGASVLAQFHHVSCDGLGALEFLRDLWAAYHNVVSGRDAGALLRPLNLRRLAGRGNFAKSRVRPLGPTAKGLATLNGVYEYFAHRPSPLPSPHNGRARNRGNANGPSGGFGTCSLTLDKVETARLRNAVKSLNCGMNDLLLRDLFLVLHAWAADHAPLNGRHCVRIMIPTSLRSFADRDMPAANRVSMVFLDCRRRAAASPDTLLDTVRREMERVKRGQLGLAMLQGIRWARRIPGGLRAMLPKDRCLATALLTNLGSARRYFPLPSPDGRILVGGAHLKRVETFAPFRPQTHAAITAIVFAGRLSLGMSYSPRQLTDDDARCLLRCYVDRLCRSARDADSSA